MYLYWKVGQADANNPRWPLWAMLIKNNGDCFVCPVTLNRDELGLTSYEMANSSTFGEIYLLLKLGRWCRYREETVNWVWAGELKDNPELLEKVNFHAELTAYKVPFLYWKVQTTDDLPTWALWAVLFNKEDNHFVVPVTFNKEDLDNGVIDTAPHMARTTLGKVYLLLGWGRWQKNEDVFPKWFFTEDEVKGLQAAWKNFLNGVPNKKG